MAGYAHGNVLKLNSKLLYFFTRAVARELGREISPAEADALQHRHGELFLEFLPERRVLPGAIYRTWDAFCAFCVSPGGSDSFRYVESAMLDSIKAEGGHDKKGDHKNT